MEGTRDLGYARLALHRALGGAWTTNHEPVPFRQGEASKGIGTKLRTLWERRFGGPAAGSPSANTE